MVAVDLETQLPTVSMPDRNGPVLPSLRATKACAELYGALSAASAS